ncbi:hypothetical protein [Methylosinus sp. RM1]|uniref:hypothetical protein n=1 Tax=Methylosinus sp. RM1 TaxID=2583817 RepID=UPI00140A432D|nr:hypothetical protein [Methylosinus sp. RM1]
MVKQKCEYCGDEYSPRQHNQRFCGSVCSNAYHQAERRRAVELLRSQTYYGRELVGAAEAGGRYAAVGAVNLGGPLPLAAHQRDPVPAEPTIEGNPLTYGEDVSGRGR